MYYEYSRLWKLEDLAVMHAVEVFEIFKEFSDVSHDIYFLNVAMVCIVISIAV